MSGGRRRRAAELSERDRQILGFVGQTGVASARQIERLAFPATSVSERSELSAARRCRRVLGRLHQDGFLLRLERRLGGVRAGSAGYLYQLGTRGKRALQLSGRGRTWEPGGRFIDHALAVAELHVGLVVAERSGLISQLQICHEPGTWRRFTTATGPVTLKPDLLVELTTNSGGADGWELRWFIEIDRGTEHLPTVLAKCHTYEQYWRSGREVEQSDIFPKVLWSVSKAKRAGAIGDAIRHSRTLTDELFAVATADQAARVLGGEQADHTNNQTNQGGGQP